MRWLPVWPQRSQSAPLSLKTAASTMHSIRSAQRFQLLFPHRIPLDKRPRPVVVEGSPTRAAEMRVAAMAVARAAAVMLAATAAGRAMPAAGRAAMPGTAAVIPVVGKAVAAVKATAAAAIPVATRAAAAGPEM